MWGTFSLLWLPLGAVTSWPEGPFTFTDIKLEIFSFVMNGLHGNWYRCLHLTTNNSSSVNNNIGSHATDIRICSNSYIINQFKRISTDFSLIFHWSSVRLSLSGNVNRRETTLKQIGRITLGHFLVLKTLHSWGLPMALFVTISIFPNVRS